MARVQYPTSSQASDISGSGMLVVYSDAACTVLADIALTQGGSTVSGSTLTVSNSIPTFYGPDPDPAILFAKLVGADRDDPPLALTPAVAVFTPRGPVTRAEVFALDAS